MKGLVECARVLYTKEREISSLWSAHFAFPWPIISDFSTGNEKQT